MRLDQFLVQYKNVTSRTKAQDLIEAGHIYIVKNNQKVTLKKPSFSVEESDHNLIFIAENDANLFVSRAGHKLNGALHFLKINVTGYEALDVGQSTGGFTDCLLQQGVQSVVGIDVGIGQIHEKIKSHAKVKCFEKVNAKNLSDIEFFKNKKFDIIVCDVSFISLTKVVDSLKLYLKPGAEFLFLIKPQFECGPNELDKNGLVKDEKVIELVNNKIKNFCEKVFSCPTTVFPSSIDGKDGNKEFFIYGKTN